MIRNRSTFVIELAFTIASRIVEKAKTIKKDQILLDFEREEKDRI